MSLTALEIKTAKPKEKKYKLYDSNYLYLEVYPNGKKQWMYKHKNGKEFKIGNYPAFGLKEARLQRDKLIREIELKGLDKVAEERKEKRLNKKRKFENVVKDWLIVYKKGKAESGVKKTINRIDKHILPIFKGKDISKITIKDIYNLLNKVEKPTAEKLKSILNGIFSYALSKEYIHKTGTLTKNEMTLQEIYLSSGEKVFISGSGYEIKGEFKIENENENSKKNLSNF
jgi:hypothetical protein